MGSVKTFYMIKMYTNLNFSGIRKEKNFQPFFLIAAWHQNDDPTTTTQDLGCVLSSRLPVTSHLKVGYLCQNELIEKIQVAPSKTNNISGSLRITCKFCKTQIS